MGSRCRRSKFCCNTATAQHCKTPTSQEPVLAFNALPKRYEVLRLWPHLPQMPSHVFYLTVYLTGDAATYVLFNRSRRPRAFCPNDGLWRLSWRREIGQMLLCLTNSPESPTAKSPTAPTAPTAPTPCNAMSSCWLAEGTSGCSIATREEGCVLPSSHPHWPPSRPIPCPPQKFLEFVDLKIFLKICGQERGHYVSYAQSTSCAPCPGHIVQAVSAPHFLPLFAGS